MIMTFQTKNHVVDFVRRKSCKSARIKLKPVGDVQHARHMILFFTCQF